MLGLLGHAVAFHHRQRRIDHDLALGLQGVTDPAQPDLTEAELLVASSSASTRSTSSGSTASISRR